MRNSSVPVAPDAKAIGTNTQECLQSGITLGYRGLVKEILKQIRLEMQAADAREELRTEAKLRAERAAERSARQGAGAVPERAQRHRQVMREHGELLVSVGLCRAWAAAGIT